MKKIIKIALLEASELKDTTVIKYDLLPFMCEVGDYVPIGKETFKIIGITNAIFNSEVIS